MDRILHKESVRVGIEEKSRMNVEAVTQRVRAEFQEMPGLTLTEDQAAKLFGIEQKVCRDVINQLVDASYLRKTRSGSVTRGDR